MRTVIKKTDDGRFKPTSEAPTGGIKQLVTWSALEGMMRDLGGLKSGEFISQVELNEDGVYVTFSSVASKRD